MAVRSQVDIILRAVGAGQVSSALTSIRSGVTNLAKSFLPFATVGGAFAAIPLLIRNASASAERFDDLADRIGATLEGVQVLDFLSRKSGQGAEVFAHGLDNLRRHLAEARAGSEKAYAPFRALNLTVEEFNALPAERQLDLLAKAMIRADDPSAAFLAVTELLGTRAVPELRVALERRAVEGYDKVAASAKAAGQIMSDRQVQQLAAANDRIEELQRRATVIGGTIAGVILDVGNPVKDVQDAATRVDAAVAKYGESSRRVARVRLELAQLLADYGQLQAAQDQLLQVPAKLPALKDAFDTESPLASTRAQFEQARVELAERLQKALQPKSEAVVAEEKLTSEVKARALAEEQAGFWLKANQQKIEAAVEANRQALLDDQERLKLTQMRVAGIDAEVATAKAVAGSDAERTVAVLKHAEERSKLLRDIADLERRITTEQERQTREAQAKQIATVRAEQIATEDRLAQIVTSRRDIERSTILDLSTKRLRLDENTKAYQEQLAQVILLKEAELSMVKDIEQRASLEREIARIRREGAEFGAATAEPTRFQRSVAGFEQRGSPQTSFQSIGQGAAGGAMDFMTGVGTAADSAALSVENSLNEGLRGTQDLLYNLSTGAITFSDAWSQATAWVGQQFLRMSADMVARMLWRSTVERSLIALGVTTHVAGEATKTSATLAGGTLRIGTAIKEALAAVYHGAIEAFKAMAGIPYVGPFVAAAAMAAAIATGINLVSKIGHADGAIIRGPGGPRDDRIPAMLSNGEAVTRAAVVSKFGESFFRKLNDGVLDLSAIRGGIARADGGLAIAGSMPDIFIPDRAEAFIRQSRHIDLAAGRSARDNDSSSGLSEPRDVRISAFFDKHAMCRAMLSDFDTKVIDVIDRARHRWNL